MPVYVRDDLLVRESSISDLKNDWAENISLNQLRTRLLGLGVRGALRVKELGPNNNSKNQIYLAPDLADLSWIPIHSRSEIIGSSRKPNASRSPLLHRGINFAWVGERSVSAAPFAQLIYYPQYPEVRLSGLLRGSPSSPSSLLQIGARGQEPGRFLILAVDDRHCVLAVLVSRDSRIAAELRAERSGSDKSTLLWQVPLRNNGSAASSVDLLCNQLCRIQQLGWVPGERLKPDGNVVSYNSRNGGGYTLERHLGIRSNPSQEPDYLGIEIKQFSSDRVTIFDVSPDGGEFTNRAHLEFFSRHGRLNQNRHRYDFTFRSKEHEVVLDGYSNGKITSSTGSVMLCKGSSLLMAWSFERLMEKWERKHALAAFIQSESDNDGNGNRIYRFSGPVELGVGARFNRFLLGVEQGQIRVDPGVHLDFDSRRNSWGSPKTRTPFRVRAKRLGDLYEESTQLHPCGYQEAVTPDR